MDTLSRREREKQMREEDIINAAEKTFYIVGYNKASMDEIAKEAQFTRKTVYQYFKDKEDLYFAVVSRGFRRLISYLEESIQDGKNGFEKLQSLASAYYSFYLDFPSTFHLMNYVGYVKSNDENLNKYEEFNKLSRLLSQKVAQIIDEGKSDGSIREDLDTMSLTYSAEFIITGFFHILSVSGQSFTNHFSLDKENFIKFNMNLICDAFHAKNSDKE